MSSGEGGRAGNGDSAFGGHTTLFVIYGDAQSLEADCVQMSAETAQWPMLPPGIDFTSSDVFVRGVYLSSNELEIDVERIDTNMPDVTASAVLKFCIE